MKKHLLRLSFYTLLLLSASSVSAQVIATVAGTGNGVYNGEGIAATAANLNNPDGLAVDHSGNIYICDINHNRIRKVNSAGIITLVAGNDTAGYSGDGSLATAAKVNTPISIIYDSVGNLLFSDAGNNCIRKINPAGIISTVVGTGVASFSGDGGPATAATLNQPMGIALDKKGNLYITDAGNSRIRKVNRLGVITTIAGNGISGYNGDNIAATTAKLYPTGVAVDKIGNIYIADWGNFRVRVVDTINIIRTFAGTGVGGFSTENVLATATPIQDPNEVKIDDSGNVYISDPYNNLIHKVNPAGIMKRFAGFGGIGYSGDGSLATLAMLHYPTAMTFDDGGNMFISDNMNNRIRKVINCRLGAISGGNAVCAGGTLLLSDTTSGGVWGSVNTSVATVSAGTVTGVATGSTSIFYTLANGCSDTQIINVVTLPSDTVIGQSSICLSTSATLHSTAVGSFSSVWTSSAASIATVSASGIVTADTTPGVVFIGHIISNACGSDSTYHAMNVVPKPVTGTISGRPHFCAGDTGTFVSTIASGKWSISAGSIIDSVSGLATITSPGTTVVNYTMSNSACSVATHDTLHIAPLPALSSTLSPAALCSGTAFHYTPVSTAASPVITWVRTPVAGISNTANSDSGSISEVLYDTTALPAHTTYWYSVTSGGCTNVQQVMVNVKPKPSLITDTTISVCSDAPFAYPLASLTPGTVYHWWRTAVTGIAPYTNIGDSTLTETLVNTLGVPVIDTYNIRLTANGCVDTQHVTVRVQPHLFNKPRITTRSPSWLCLNSMYQNFGTDSVSPSGTTYHWSAIGATVYATGSTHQYCLINFTQPGFATILLSATNTITSCPSIDTFIVGIDGNTADVPQVIYNSPYFLCLENDEATFQWGYDDAATLDSTILTGETGQTYANASPDANKHYWVMTALHNCKQKTYYKNPTAISNVNTATGSMELYPVPNTGTFTVQLNGVTEKGTITVTDMVCRKIAETPSDRKTTIELPATTPAGTYIVTVTTPQTKWIKKFNVIK